MIRGATTYSVLVARLDNSVETIKLMVKDGNNSGALLWCDRAMETLKQLRELKA